MKFYDKLNTLHIIPHSFFLEELVMGETYFFGVTFGLVMRGFLLVSRDYLRWKRSKIVGWQIDGMLEYGFGNGVANSIMMGARLLSSRLRSNLFLMLCVSTSQIYRSEVLI